MDDVIVDESRRNKMEETCKAIIQQGVSKGSRCWRPSSENGYCGKHQSQHKVESGATQGLHKCRTHRCIEMLSPDRKYCDTCIASKDSVDTKCKSTVSQGVNRGKQCPNNASTPEGYCGKHAIQILVDKALAEGRRICDDAKRKCRKYTIDGKMKCEECLDKIREIERNEHKEKRENELCLGCGCEIDTLLQGARKQVQRCDVCFEKHKEVESQRVRERNYLAERKNNLERHYHTYSKNAVRRNLTFYISIETFETLVNSPCNYCGQHEENEAIGIDRVNNMHGYENDNVVPCCERCNRMKMDMSLPDFIHHIQKILAHYTLPETTEHESIHKSYVPPKKILAYYRKGLISEYIQRCVEDGRNVLFIEKLKELEDGQFLTDVEFRAFIKHALKHDTPGYHTRINTKELFAYLKNGQPEKCIEAYEHIHGIPIGFREDIEILVADWDSDDETNQTAFHKLLLKYQNKRNR